MTLTTRQPGSLTTALILLAAALISFPPALPADDGPRLIELKIGETTCTGRLLRRSGDQVWLMDQFGSISQLPVNGISSMRIISEHFRLAGKHEYIRKLQDELPPHFSVTATPHYIVAADSDSTEIYAAALEDIYLEVHAAMHRLGLNPTQPELPLTAVIFPDTELFRHYCDRDQMKWSEELSGYYSAKSNRIAVLERHTPEPGPKPPERQILTAAATHNPRIRPAAALQRLTQSTRQTLVHEASHQIGFNCAVHSRIASGPQWLIEGLALLLEAETLRTHKNNRPSLPSAHINPERLQWFHNQYLPRYTPGDLAGIIASDDLFSHQPLDAYSLAWAFTCFLCTTDQQELRQNFARYVRLTARLRGPGAGTPEQRLEQFRQTIGDPDLLETQFLRFIQSPAFGTLQTP